REDLFYRLHIVPIELPPLRDRPGDIKLLAEHFVKKLAPRTNRHVTGLSDEVVAALLAYRWPGNVREIENAIEQALVFADGPLVERRDLPPFLSGASAPLPAAAPTVNLEDDNRTLDEILESLEKSLILRAFRKAAGVKTETARLLGIKTSALYYKLDKYGVTDADAKA
ncbi:MAG: sigma-54-dependent Fis family transcriptional regulator, partial [Deltaproteobacteria bacterium]|nr:sigma-54-dependent Fis family transcriptional regulator [Deltaproteobacteria bacterium]